jgi:hypothetical protein
MTNKALAKLYEVPKTSRENKDTTSKDELELLAWRLERAGYPDPVFESTIKLRGYDTVINNYIPNWQPADDGRVHTQWGFKAASGQLDSSNPNVLNISKHTETGQRFRRIIVAPHGYCFVELDKKSFHVATLGYLANDENYLRFSQLDPHSIFTSYIMPSEWGRPIQFNWSDAEIKEQCKAIKKRSKAEKEKLGDRGVDLRQDTAKPCVLGNQLGLGPKKLWYQNRKAIRSIEHARELQSVIANLFPKVEEWKSDIIAQANRDTYLIDEWGKIQFFYEVYRWERDRYTGKWKKIRTNEAEKVLAFRVQGVAFGMLKYESLLCEERGYNERYNFINTIHDSLVFMPSLADRDRCIADVGTIMNSPCPVLVNQATGHGGLVVKAEISWGLNMANQTEANPDGMREIEL